MKRFLKTGLFFVIAFIVIIFLPYNIYSQDNIDTEAQLTIQDKVLMVQPSVCFVSTFWSARVYDDNTEKWSEPYYYGPVCGTGFCVNSETGHIITAGHVVDIPYNTLKREVLDRYILDEYPDDYYELSESDWDTIFIFFKVEGIQKSAPDREIFVQFNQAVASIPVEKDEKFIRAELIELSDRKNKDIAMIQIQPVAGKALSAAIIADSSSVEILDPVKIIGYPWTSEIGQDNPLNTTVTSGTLSGNIMIAGNQLIQIQGDARPGNSGGPVLNLSGEVIGIITNATDETNNYLRPGNDIKVVMGKVANKTGTIDEEWKTGLLMFRQKHYSEAIKHFSNVLNLNQTHFLAQEYKAKAQNSIADDIPLVPEESVSDIKETMEAADTETSTSTTLDFEKTVRKKEGRIGLLTIIFIVTGLILLVAVAVSVFIFLRKRNLKKKILKNRNIAEPAEPVITVEELKATRKTGLKDGKEELFCSNCGATVKKNQPFCSQCGAKLNP